MNLTRRLRSDASKRRLKSHAIAEGLVLYLPKQQMQASVSLSRLHHRLCELLLCCLILFLSLALRSQGATFADSCSKVCGQFETCFVFDNAEYCAPRCMPGRCNDTTETCIIQGVECKQAPCLPIAICESKTEGSADIVVEHVTANCSRLCPMIDSPVCGSDGVSYANACYFDEAQCNNPGLSIAVHALCPEDRTFNLQYNSPLAAQDSSSGSSSAACDAIVCADIDDPVCTTSGTMKNACFLKREQCKHPYVELLRRGSCEPVPIMPRCPASCGQEYAPVCASSGVIYGNECLFRQAKCARAFASNFVARDLSYCELNVGDSSGTAQGIRTVITSVFD